MTLNQKARDKSKAYFKRFCSNKDVGGTVDDLDRCIREAGLLVDLVPGTNQEIGDNHEKMMKTKNANKNWFSIPAGIAERERKRCMLGSIALGCHYHLEGAAAAAAAVVPEVEDDAAEEEMA